MNNCKHKLTSNTLPSNKGFTLIELMITLVLSLMITYAIAQVLISSNRSSVTTDGMSQSQETGRFVMSYLANQIRQAGLNSITDDSITTQAVISCSTPAFETLVSAARPGVAAGEVACSTESSTGDTEVTIDRTDLIHGDRLAIAWIPPVPLDAANNPDEDLIQDCSGAGGYKEDQIVLNVFWVEPDDNGVNSLMCQGHRFNGTAITRSNQPQAIASGVESMHVLYGEAIDTLPDSGDRNVGRYVSAAAVGGVGIWERVYAIKISILTRSITEVTNTNTTRNYILLDSEPYIMTDAVSRQVFTTTYAISNYQ